MLASPNSQPLRGLLVDALGTLVELVPPAPALAARLREGHGLDVTPAAAARAFAAEISYYRRHHLEGADDRSLARLRWRCAEVLHAALPDPVQVELDVDSLLPEMLASLRFRPLPGAEEALAGARERGLRLAVVSNWDVSLAGILRELELDRHLDAIVSSAEVGEAKPQPAVFRRALERLGLEPAAALHVGDSWDLDVAGARAAGLEPVLLAPGASADGRERRDGVLVLPSLTAFAALI
ncbi:MAG TPA: HAD-IA family hydrolase [Solirubrobacterales bacterium]|nr:HAD-IA family hydrolase [Solirubrobacterales bacterium]